MYQVRKLSIIGMILGLAAGSPLLGEEPKRESKPDAVVASRIQTKLVKVFGVELAEPQNVLDVLLTLKLGVRFALDESSRAIVANGAEETLAVVENLIHELDKRASKVPSHTALFLPIKYRNAEDVAELVAAANRGRGRLRVVADASSNLVVLRGRTDELDAARKLVSRIDKPQATFSVSFFFIGGSMTTNGNPPATIDLPTALMPVGETLARYGLGDMALLAPLTARTQEGSEFSASGYLRSSGKGFEFLAEGDIQGIAESNTVRLRIRARVNREDPETGERTIFSIETMLVSPLGDYVVLATAPSANVEYDVLALVVRVDGLK